MKVFKRGKVIFSLDELVTALNKGEWVYYRTRPVHPEFIKRMTLQVIMGGLEGKLFAVAVRKENHG